MENNTNISGKNLTPLRLAEKTPEISLIVPMYNEALSCAGFFDKVIPIMDEITNNYEIICISDGSTDGTFEILQNQRKTHKQIKILNLSRNFGKEAAMTAGIDMATGQAVVPIDADLQDPPELLHKMVDHWRNGAQVVLARRKDRKKDPWLKRVTAAAFYHFSGKITKPPIPKDVGDFRLMDRVVVDALKKLPERSRFMKGLFAWVGYRQVTVDYERQIRHAGKTKFNYWKLWNFALDGIISFSSVPLKIWSYFGILISTFAVCYMIYLILRTLFFGIDVPGYPSLMSVILFFNGLLLFTLGALGEYVSRIFIEVKQRPIYLINEMEGFEAPVNSQTEIVPEKRVESTV